MLYEVITAYIEGEELSKEQLQEALKNWEVNVSGTNNLVTISTKGNSPFVWGYKVDGFDSDAVNAVLQELKFELADLPEMNFEMLVIPE